MKSSKVFATPQSKTPISAQKSYGAKTPATSMKGSAGRTLNAPKASGTKPHAHPAYKK